MIFWFWSMKPRKYQRTRIWHQTILHGGLIDVLDAKLTKSVLLRQAARERDLEPITHSSTWVHLGFGWESISSPLSLSYLLLIVEPQFSIKIWYIGSFWIDYPALLSHSHLCQTLSCIWWWLEISSNSVNVYQKICYEAGFFLNVVFLSFFFFLARQTSFCSLFFYMAQKKKNTIPVFIVVRPMQSLTEIHNLWISSQLVL